MKADAKDAEGIPISMGSVLINIVDGDRGVVVPDSDAPMKQDTDTAMVLYTGKGHRFTIRFGQWRHLPHDSQTFTERFISWKLTKPAGIEAPQEAIQGLLRLLPYSAVDPAHSPEPKTVDEALCLMASYLDDLTKESKRG